MTGPHRRAHRWIWAGLALLLPAVIAVALAIRPAPSTEGFAIEIEPGQGRIR